MDDSFIHVPLSVPKLSGFDKSHQNLLTSKVGTITPILIDELIPGSKVHLDMALCACLPPLATDTFMRCEIKVEAFFVPFRLLAGSFESWFTDTAVSFQNAYSSTSYFTDKKGFLPVIGPINGSTVGPDGTTPLIAYFLRDGSLMDYLGYKEGTNLTPRITNTSVTALPLLAYHRVYDDWYRNTLVQRPVFIRPQYSANTGGSGPASNNLCAGTAPYYFYSELLSNTTNNFQLTSPDHMKLADGSFLYELRQRNFGLDYFTTATPSPQQGSAQVVSFNTSGATGNFSIAALRAANSLQQFSERNNLAGTRYQDQLKARYGANLSSGVAQRAIFLGADSFEVYSKGIYTQQNATISGTSTDPNPQPTNNPFQDTAGAKYGNATAAGKGLNLNFEVDEPGYLLVNATLVPRVTYSTGINRRFVHYVGAGSVTDMANPILQNVGPQPIYDYELNCQSSSPNVFGYTDRYAEFKTMEDELHGLMRDGASMDAFALQRSFAQNSSLGINTSFLQIPTNYMDQVTAVSSSLSNYGYWLDTYFNYKVSQPIAKYSLPSLQDPAYEHGRTIVMSKGGSKL